MSPRILMLIEKKKDDNITFARDKFIVYALNNLGLEVHFFPKKDTFFLRQLKLLIHCFKYRKTYDLILISSRCKEDIVVTKAFSLLFKKPIVVDVFISTYNTLVEDRQLFSKHSWKAKFFRIFDYTVVFLSDISLLDTYEHIKYFKQNISKGNNGKKYKRVIIGSDSREHISAPVKPKNSKMQVLYNGTYIPLHGVEFILEAAARIQASPFGKNVEFIFFGDGQQRKEMQKFSTQLGLQNVKFITDYSEPQLLKYIQECSIYLGIFGSTTKAKRVIPCKVYKGLAMKSCVLSGKSNAMDELFVAGIDYIGCQFANSEEIANKIIQLSEASQLRENVAKQGHATFMKSADIPAVAKELKAVFASLEKIN